MALELHLGLLPRYTGMKTLLVYFLSFQFCHWLSYFCTLEHNIYLTRMIVLHTELLAWSMSFSFIKHLFTQFWIFNDYFHLLFMSNCEKVHHPSKKYKIVFNSIVFSFWYSVAYYLFVVLYTMYYVVPYFYTRALNSMLRMKGDTGTLIILSE